jgi:hypothetical protein
MATPNVLGAYELLRRAMQQQGGGFCPMPNSAPGYNSDGYDSPQGGLLGRLLALDAKQSPYQPPASNDGAAPATPSDPNFRQLSRVPSANRAQGAIAAPTQSAGQPGPTDSVGSSGSLDSPSATTAPVPPLGLCAAGLPGCAIGGALTAGQILLGGTALLGLGGATILNSRKSPSSGSQSGNDQTPPQLGSERYQQIMKDLAAQKAARAEAMRKKWAGKLNDPHDYCTQRYDDDVKECYKNAGDSRDLAACFAQAASRLAKCRKNGGPSRADPPKWSPDEE